VSSHESPNFPSLITVVLCCHNGERTLGDQLAALANQDYEGQWELVFVNDRSTDASASIANSWSDRLPIRIVNTEGGGGLANARNIGGKAAAGDVLLFCDDDDIADRGWISAFAQAAREAPAFGGFLEELLLNDPRVRGWRYAMTPGRLPIAFGMVQVPVGCNCGVSSSVFRDVGGFTAEFSQFGSGEDVDFYWRVQLAGHKVQYVPSAIMHIRHRQDLKSLVRQSYRYGLGNAVLYRRFRHLGIQGTSAIATLSVIAKVARGIPGALTSRRKRGAWLRMTSYACGQAVGSIRNRVWHLD
jgi:glycosyltransferase involved in cell wall biosynthesis